jgi:aminoglycoside 3-N-acetyltransferase
MKERVKVSESQLIKETPYPRTRSNLAEDLRRIGVVAGMTLIVHSSLRALGWVSGGSVAVVQALMDVISSEGTLVMPTHTAYVILYSFYNGAIALYQRM